MRKWIFILLVLIMSFGTASTSFAGDRAANGLFFGAGTGALIGQAIGRNTDATLLGTAIGGVLGFIVGNEQDKAYAQPAYYYRYPQAAYRERVVVQRPTVVYRGVPPPPVVYYPQPVPFFNLNFGWIFHDDRGYGWRGRDRGWTRHYHGWRGDNHWRGGRRHR